MLALFSCGALTPIWTTYANAYDAESVSIMKIYLLIGVKQKSKDY